MIRRHPEVTHRPPNGEAPAHIQRERETWSKAEVRKFLVTAAPRWPRSTRSLRDGEKL
jgi:hypothetical protein